MKLATANVRYCLKNGIKTRHGNELSIINLVDNNEYHQVLISWERKIVWLMNKFMQGAHIHHRQQSLIDN